MSKFSKKFATMLATYMIKSEHSVHALSISMKRLGAYKVVPMRKPKIAAVEDAMRDGVASNSEYKVLVSNKLDELLSYARALSQEYSGLYLMEIDNALVELEDYKKWQHYAVEYDAEDFSEEHPKRLNQTFTLEFINVHAKIYRLKRECKDAENPLKQERAHSIYEQVKKIISRLQTYKGDAINFHQEELAVTEKMHALCKLPKNRVHVLDYERAWCTYDDSTISQAFDGLPGDLQEGIRKLQKLHPSSWRIDLNKNIPEQEQSIEEMRAQLAAAKKLPFRASAVAGTKAE